MSSKDDYERRLLKMVQYIEQDGHEKAEEIDVLAEEEYYMEKNAYMGNRFETVRKYYDRLEQKYQQRFLLDISKIKNEAYQDMLKAHNVVIEEIFNAAATRLSQVTLDVNICCYKKVLYQLAIQGLIKIMEPRVIVEVQERDVQLAKKIIKQAEEYFKQKTGLTTNAVVSETTFVPEKMSGGLYMYDSRRLVILDNTLDSKLEVIRSHIMPYVRDALFGVNVNRRHLD